MSKKIEQKMWQLIIKWNKPGNIKEDKQLLKVITQHMKNKTSGKLLDAGCGLGDNLNLIKNANLEQLELFGIDVNPDLVENATRNGYHAKISDLRHIQYPDETFDIVIASHVIEHFGYPDITNVLHELFRVTKPGGIVIIKSLLFCKTFYNDIDHVRPYYPETLGNYFCAAQQQQVGNIKAYEIYRWYQTYPPFFSTFRFSDMLKMYIWKYTRLYPSDRCNYGVVYKK